jgi:hypothetical protein
LQIVPMVPVFLQDCYRNFCQCSPLNNCKADEIYGNIIEWVHNILHFIFISVFHILTYLWLLRYFAVEHYSQFCVFKYLISFQVKDCTRKTRRISYRVKIFWWKIAKNTFITQFVSVNMCENGTHHVAPLINKYQYIK